MPLSKGALLSFRARGLVGGHRRGWTPAPLGVVTSHLDLTNRDEEDHPKYGPLSQANAWAALATFDAGIQLSAAQVIEDWGGSSRIALSTTAPHVTLTGDVRAGDTLGVGIDPLVTYTLRLTAPAPLFGGIIPGRYLSLINAWAPTVNNSLLSGLFGQPEAAYPTGAVTTGHIIRGLDFVSKVTGGTAGTTVSELTAVYATLGAFATFSATIARGLYVPAPGLIGTVSIATLVGAEIGNMGGAKVVDGYGVRLADITGNSGLKRLLELGKNPEMRLESGDPTDPGAGFGRSGLLLAFNENGSVNVRRVEWEDFSTLSAGDRVLRAV